jgi:hypothetical protein
LGVKAVCCPHYWSLTFKISSSQNMFYLWLTFGMISSNWAIINSWV